MPTVLLVRQWVSHAGRSPAGQTRPDFSGGVTAAFRDLRELGALDRLGSVDLTYA